MAKACPGDNWIGTANPKYYVLAHYTRHIRPGMTIVDGGKGNTVAAYDAAARKLILVTMNYGTAQTITYNLSNFFSATGPVRRWMTTTGPGVRYATYEDTPVSNRWFRCAFGTNTIQTFEVRNVDLNPPPQLGIARGPGAAQTVLSWPGWSAGYTLYRATNLAQPIWWRAVTNPPAASNNTYSVVLPATNRAPEFYRLSNP